MHGSVDRNRVVALRSVALGEADEALALDPGPLCTGLHPWDVRAESWEDDLHHLERLLATGRFRALGEAGLDRSRPPGSSLQMEAFLRQIELSERFVLPLLVHCVRAASDLLGARSRRAARQTWILHGWNGSLAQTEDLLGRTDFVFSFGASILHPGSKSREGVAIVPDDRILLETDDSGIAIESIEQEASLLRETGITELRGHLHATWDRLFER